MRGPEIEIGECREIGMQRRRDTMRRRHCNGQVHCNGQIDCQSAVTLRLTAAHCAAIAGYCSCEAVAHCLVHSGSLCSAGIRLAGRFRCRVFVATHVLPFRTPACAGNAAPTLQRFATIETQSQLCHTLWVPATPPINTPPHCSTARYLATAHQAVILPGLPHEALLHVIAAVARRRRPRRRAHASGTKAGRRRHAVSHEAASLAPRGPAEATRARDAGRAAAAAAAAGREEGGGAGDEADRLVGHGAVSYTHLTLPTKA